MSGYVSGGNGAAAPAAYDQAPMILRAPTHKRRNVRVGDVLTVVVPAADLSGKTAITLDAQWYRDGVAIPGATALTYTAVAADLSARLNIMLTPSNSAGPGYPVASRQTYPVQVALAAAAPKNVVAPALLGAPVAGKLLTISGDQWLNGPIIERKYEWVRNGSVIVGATTAAWTSAVTDIGAVVYGRVTAYGPSGSTTIATPSVTIQAGAAVLAASLTAISPIAAVEGNAGSNSRTITVTLSGPAPVGASVDWSVAGIGSNPVSAADFVGGVLPFGTINFGVGALSGTATFAVQGDTDIEPNEDFRVTIANPQGGLQIGVASLDGSILNDDAAAPPGIVTAVAVAPEGNRLRVTLNAAPLTAKFSNFPDDGAAIYTHPDVPRTVDNVLNVKVTVQSQGYTRSAGAAVAAQQTREIWATLLARQTGDSGTPGASAMNYPLQILNGNGTHTIELWLEQCVYGTDTVTAVEFGAGWRTGGGAQSFGAMANASALNCPFPILRNLNLPNHLVRGAAAFRVDYDVVAHHPRSFGVELHQAVAGLKVTAIDSGGNSVSKWVFGESLSQQYGDSYYCWGVEAAAAGLLTGLTPGLITVHAEAYPWIGPSWKTGDTYVASTGTPTRQIGPDQPLMIYYDPAEALYPAPRYMVCDPVGGSTTIANITAGASDTLAAAKAQSVRPLNLSAAFAKARAINPDISNWKFVVPAGTTQFGSVSVSGITASVGCEIIGDPDDPAPRANCIFDIEAALSGVPAFVHYRRLRLNRTATPIPNGGYMILNQLDFVTATSNPNLIAAAPSDDFASVCSAAGVNWLGHWWSTHSNGRLVKLNRSATGPAIGGVVIVNGIATPGPDYSPFWSWGNVDFRLVKHCMALRRGDSGFVDGPSSGTTRSNRYTRFAYVNSLYERRGETGWNFRAFQWEDFDVRESILEGLTILGAGHNWHNWKVGGTNLPGRYHGNNRIANIIWHRLAHKGDNEIGSAAYVSDAAARAGQELQSGVGFEACVNMNIVDTGAVNNLTWFGRRMLQSSPLQINVDRPSVGFVAEREYFSAAPTSDIATPGDYRLSPASTVRTIGRSANTGRYLSGVARPAQFAPGALEAI